MRTACAHLLAALIVFTSAWTPDALARVAAAGDAWSIPVLMYHRVDARLSSDDSITVHLTVMAPAFEAQLRFLSGHGYRSATLDDLWTALVRHVPVSPRRVVLTFDDGYEDNYTVAFPLLRHYGFTATFFVVTSTVGTRGHLTVAQIQEMARAGMTIESHGVHHVDFSRLSLRAARTQLIRSRQMIQAWTGHPVTFFAYPVGRYTPELERLLADLGYHGAVTEVPGFVRPRSDPYALERVRVDHDDTVATFAHTLGIHTP